MRNKLVFTGILAVALVFGMLLTACGEAASQDTTKTFTVSYDGGEGSGTPPRSQEVKDGESIDLPGKGNLRAPEGKEFDGWKGGGGTWATGDSYTVTRDVMFTAQWKSTTPVVPNPPPNTPVVPTGVKVRVGHFGIEYQDEVITKITISEYDELNDRLTVYQNAAGLALGYGQYWEDGLITKTGGFIIKAIVGAGTWEAEGWVSIYDLSGPAVVLQYDGYDLIRQ